MVPECKTEWNREAIKIFSRLPSLTAADKPCPRLQPSLIKTGLDMFIESYHNRDTGTYEDIGPHHIFRIEGEKNNQDLLILTLNTALNLSSENH